MGARIKSGMTSQWRLCMIQRFAADPARSPVKDRVPCVEGVARRKAQSLEVSVPKHGGRLSARHMRKPPTAAKRMHISQTSPAAGPALL